MSLPSLTSILLGKQFIGIEHFTLNNEENTSFLLAENKNDELIISKKDITTYSEIIANTWDKSLPFYIVINTNHVIQKEIAGIDSTNDKLIHKAFPNLAWDEFYYEIWRMKTKSLIAISRKNYVDEIISNYDKQGISITGLSLGVCSISEITTYFDKNELDTNNQVISFNDENPIVTPKNTSLVVTYDINGLTIQNTHLLAFTGILRLLDNGIMTTGNLTDYNYQLYENYNQKSFFIKGIKIMIGVLMTILLINFLVFNFYYKKNQEISESLLINQSSLEETTKTKGLIKIKEEKVKNFIDLSSSKSSRIINEITSTLPFSILLTELTFNPLERKIKVDEPIVTLEKTILISGTTVDPKAFTLWIEEIEELKWINQVTIVNFGNDETNETVFSIKLTLK